MHPLLYMVPVKSISSLQSITIPQTKSLCYERTGQFRKHISTSNKLHKVIMTSVSNEGRGEAHTQRVRELKDGGIEGDKVEC